MKSLLLLPIASAVLNGNCSTPDAALRCEAVCGRETFECVSRCPPSDSSCHSECNRQGVSFLLKLEVVLCPTRSRFSARRDVPVWANCVGTGARASITQPRICAALMWTSLASIQLPNTVAIICCAGRVICAAAGRLSSRPS